MVQAVDDARLTYTDQYVWQITYINWRALRPLNLRLRMVVIEKFTVSAGWRVETAT